MCIGCDGGNPDGVCGSICIDLENAQDYLTEQLVLYFNRISTSRMDRLCR